MSAATWVLVGLLGGGAATARFLIDATIASRSDHPFPLGILAINLAGAFASAWWRERRSAARR